MRRRQKVKMALNFYTKHLQRSILVLFLAVSAQCNHAIYNTNHDKFDISKLSVNKYKVADLDGTDNVKTIFKDFIGLKFENINNFNEYSDDNIYKDVFKRSAEDELTSDEATAILNATDSNNTGIDLHEKLVNLKKMRDGNSTKDEIELEPKNMTCVGDQQYCNLTEEEYIEMLNNYIFPLPYEWVLIATHAIVFIIGLIGNALVCVAVYRNHSMRTVTNYFIVNLAVADFMVILFCLPPTVLWDVTETWFFGTEMCRIILYFQSVSVTVSVLTLTFISVDRWYAICFPLRFNSTTGRAKISILIIWLLSLLFNVPELVVLQAKRKQDLRFNVQYFVQCTPTWSTESDLNWHIIKALFLYTFPLFLMMVAYCQIVRVLWRSDNIPGHTESHKYSPAGQNNWLAASRRNTLSIHANSSTEGQLRSRRKAAKMLVAVVVMFAVCYFPVHLLSVLRYAFNMEQSDELTCIALITHVMCYANSAVNPLIYNFMSGKFRREFHRSFYKCPCWCFGGSLPDRNGTSFAPIGSSRGTTRTVARRNDSCASHRLNHLSPSNNNTNSLHRDFGRTTNTSFIENNNANRQTSRIRNGSLSESARFNVENRE